MKRSFGLFAITLVICFKATAQTSGNHLLWRISGNGLSKPSYLFGTMHLTDKRLFYFGDSLYSALERSEGFAAEIDFNAFLTKYFEKMIGERGADSYVKDRVDPNLLKKNKRKLEEKFGKPVDEITMNDLKKQETDETAKMYKSGGMATFMDAYLIGLADKQGKWIGGIEDPEDQLGLDTVFTTGTRLSALVEQDKKNDQLEWMIKTYLNEKLEAIDLSSKLWKGSRDIILIRRNVKMAYRVDSLAHVRSCFFAVGAAHLPGDSGVVTLLREKGFTVTPVISSKKIDPEKYTFKEIERAWVDVWPKDSLYRVQMPIAPTPLKGLEESPMNMLFYYDPVATTAYFTANIPIAGATQQIKDSVIANMLRYYRKNATDLEEKDILIAGKPGKELVMEANGGQLRLQLTIPDNYVLMNMVGGIKREALFAKNANRFLSSYKPEPARSEQYAKQRVRTWKVNEYPRDAFSIQTPVRLKRTEAKIQEGESWRRVIFEGPDPVGQSHYMITADVIAPGYYAQDDTSFINQSERWYREQAGEWISSGAVKLGDVNGYEIKFKPKDGNGSFITKLVMMDRGNRRYTLYRTYDPTIQRTDEPDQFFESFRLLQPSMVQWKTVEAEGGFSTYAPGSGFKTDTATSDKLTYTVYDSLAAASFSVIKEILPSGYWAKDHKEFFDSRVKTFHGINDSLLKRIDVQNGKLKGTEVMVRMGASPILKKVRIMLSGDTLYTLYAFLPEGQISIAGFNRFFDDFKPAYENAESPIFQRTPEQFLAELFSTDSMTFQKAKDGIDVAPFTAADVPLLQEAMLKEYKEFDTLANYWGGTVNSKIADRLIQLDTVGANVAFVKKNFHSLTKENDLLKYSMLELLSSQRTEESYSLLKQLLEEPLPAKEAYIFLAGLQDSLLLAKGLYPEALHALDNDLLMTQFADLTITLLDSGLIELDMVSQRQQQLLQQAGRLTVMDADALETDSYNYLRIIELISRLNLKESNAMLHKLTRVPSPDICEAAVAGLLRNKEPLSKAEVLPLAKADQYRRSLYDSLAGAGRLNIFPAEFLTQRWLAQSDIFSNAYDEEEYKPVISFIKEKTIQYEGKMKKFYLFRIGYEEDEESSYLGVAGPYPVNPKMLKSEGDATGIYWKEIYDVKKTDTQFREFLKQLSEREEEEE